jgi:flagellar FliJ protein
MKSKRLAIVLELAEREKDQAAQAFEQARQQYAQEEQKLAQLEDYYQDYARSFTSTRTLRVEDLVKQRSFLQQLSQAIQQQQGLLQTVKNAVEQKRQAWQKSHVKHKNLADLITRYRAEEQAVTDKKEQKMLDEWFQQSRARH